MAPTPPRAIAGSARGSGWRRELGGRGDGKASAAPGTPAEAAGRGRATGRRGEVRGRSTGTQPAARRAPPPAGGPSRAPQVAAGARTRGFRRRAAQDVSSPGPYLVKVFQDSVIQQVHGANAGQEALALLSASLRPSVFQAKGDISSSPNIVPDDLVFAKLSTEFHVCALQIGSAGPATSDPISHSNTVFILFSWKSCESFKTQQARPRIFPHSPGGSRAPSLEDLAICTNLHSRTCNGMTCDCLSSPTGL
ncbi:uncharacterized protein [Vicugna pacos]|uniref:Uncharacterized protein n=1 Tax=Vicugna pacos TaxID=30538 RepID=A0ABM5EFD2_VICPA